MGLKKLLIGFSAALAIGAAAQTAHADVICQGCPYLTGEQGSYLGIHNPATFDQSIFFNFVLPNPLPPPPAGGTPAGFVNTWVFDLAPEEGVGSISATNVLTSLILNFRGRLYEAAPGTNCGAQVPGSNAAAICTSVVLGNLLHTADAVNVGDGNQAWGITQALQPGRYVLLVDGSAAFDNSFYTGLLSFVPVPEPQTLLLLAIGLISAGVASRRRAH